jgi:hypothetical protein
MSLEENVSNLNQEVLNEDLQSPIIDNEPIDPEEEKERKKLREAKNLEIWNDAKAKFGIENSINVSSYGSAADLRRYQSFGEPVFGDIGYTTLLDINKIYNENTSISQDFSRQIEGMWELAEIGFSDTFGFGLFAEDDNAVDFMEVMNTYSSSREGSMSTFGNALLSSGYTVGIIGAIAAEEALLTATTALTGLGGAGVQAVETAALGARAASNISKFKIATNLAGQAYDKAGDMVNFWKGARKIGEARVMASSARYTKDWLKGRAIQGIGLIGKGFRGAMPLSSTAGFLRNLDNLSDINTATKVALGAGALARDGRKFYLAHSESKLEADINRNENLEEATAKWYKNNPGQVMPLDVYQNFQKAADEAWGRVYNANYLTIYTTNALALDNLLKPMSSLAMRTAKANAARVGIGGIKAVSKGGGKVAFEATETGLNNWLNNLSFRGTAKKTASFIAQSSGEGFQEVFQDIYQAGGKEYFSDKFLDLQDQTANALSKLTYNSTGLKARANFFNSIGDAATGNGIYKGKSAATWESFWSGFLIGFVAGPTNLVTQTVTDYTVGDKNYIWSSKATDKYYKDLERRKEVAEILTAFYGQSGNFVAEQVNENLSASINSHSEMLKAIRTGNDMAAHDSKSDFFRYGLEKVLEHGFEKEFIDHFNQMNEMTLEELNQATNRKDITEENKDDVLQSAAEYVSRIKEYKKNFDERNNNPGMLNPYSMKGLELNNPENINTIIDYQAWELMRSDYIFNRDAIYDFAQRVDKMKSKIKEDSNISDSELNVLVSEDLLNQEVNALEEIIKENEEYSTKENRLNQTEDALEKKAKLNALKKIQKAYETLNERAKLFEEGKAKRISKSEEAAYDLMFEGFNEYMNTVDNEVDSVGRRAINRNKFKFLWDIPILNKRSKKFKEHALSLLDPQYRERFHESLVESLTFLENNKKQFIEESLKALSEKETAKRIVEKLIANNLAFSLKEIDDLVNKGIMPSQIFNTKTNKDATKEEYDIALEIINREYNNLTGKKITATKGVQFTRKKLKSDKRTAANLLEEYGHVSTVGELIDAMRVTGRNILAVEEAVLDQLELIPGFRDTEIIISNSLDAPIEIVEEDGKSIISVDVRFASSDYVGGTNRFEALSMSAILTTQLNSALEQNETFRNSVISLMEKTKVDFKNTLDTDQRLTQQLKDQGWESSEEYVNAIPYLNDVATFLSESLHNKDLQTILVGIKDDSAQGNVSISNSLKNSIQDIFELNLEGTLLERALGLAQLSFSAEDVSAFETAETTIEEITTEGGITIEELGITQEQWDALTEEEKNDIRKCR